MLDDLMQFLVILAASTVLVVVLATWIAHFFSCPNHSLIERGTYRLLGVNPEERMSWKRYGLALLLSNAAMLLLGYILLRVQGWIPGDSLQRAAQTPDLAFNTAVSFTTNTNWQAYSGESS